MGRDVLKASNGNMLLLDLDGKTTSLKEAVGMMALSLYDKYVEYSNCEDDSLKPGLEKSMLFQSRILESLSDAQTAIRKGV